MTILARGSVTDRPWGMTLGALGNRGLSGQVSIAADGKQYVVAFEGGVIVGAHSPIASDAAVRLALTSNLITSTQVADITRRLAAAPHRDEVDLIAEITRLAPDQAARLRRRLVAVRAARTFTPARGEFVVEDSIAIPVVPGGELDVRTVVYLGAKTNLAEARLVSELQQLGGYFELKPEALEDLPQFGFTPAEKPALEMVREGAYVDEIIAAQPALDERVVRAVVYALAACGACKLGAPPRSPRALTPSTSPTFQQAGRATDSAATQLRPNAPRTLTPSTAPANAPRTLTPSTAPANAPRTPTPSTAPANAPRTVTPQRNAPPGQPQMPRTSTGNAVPTMSRTSTGASVPTAQSTGVPHPAASSGSGAVPRPVAPSPSGAIPGPMASSSSGGVPRPVTPSPPGAMPAGRPRTPSTPPPGTENFTRSRTPSVELPISSPARPTPSAIPPRGESSPPGPARPTPSAIPPRGESPPPGPAIVDAPTAQGRKTAAAPPRRARRDSTAVHEIEHLLESRVPMLDSGVDHFTLLGLSIDAPAADVKSAYFTLARKLHPDRLSAIGVEDDERRAQRLMAQVNLAFAVLNDPVKREEYASIVRRGGEAAVKAEEARADELAMRVMRAEEAFKQGEMALRRDQLKQAIEQFQMAVELQPREAEYQALLAWAQFATASDKTKVANETRKALLRAVDANERSPTAKFYLGRVERMLGREREALQHFQDVLAIKPNHAEAASEVRILQQRLNKR